LLDRRAETDARLDAPADDWDVGNYDARVSSEWIEPDSASQSAAAQVAWRDWARTAGRIATLGAAAACGFDLVLVALSHGVGETHHGSGHSVKVMQEAEAQAVVAPVQAAPAADAAQVLADGEIPSAREVVMVAQLSSPAPLQAGQDPAPPPARRVAPAMVNVTVPQAPPVAASPAPVRVAPIMLARGAAPFAHVTAHENGPVKDVAAAQSRDGRAARAVVAAKAAHAPAPWLAPRGWRAGAHGAPVVLARFEPKSRAPHAVPAVAFDVPGWLAAEHVAAPRVLVMSEPPHNLVHPADKAPASVAPAAGPVSVASAVPQPAPIRRLPPLVVASSAYGGGAAYGGQAYRPYYGGYYGSPYAAPYGGYYPPSYGAYYGGYGAGGP